MYYVKLYQDLRGEWRWRLVARNGRIVADSSEGYVEKTACIAMAEVIFEEAKSVRLEWATGIGY